MQEVTGDYGWRLRSRLCRVINDDCTRYDKSNFKHRVGPIVSGVHIYIFRYYTLLSVTPKRQPYCDDIYDCGYGI